MFWPSTIAVVGASTNLATYGGQTVDMLVSQGFTGRIVPVNPKHESIAGLPTAPSVLAIGDAIDLALIMVPAPAVLDVVRECADAGVACVAIFSAGFAEQDAVGAVRQEEVLAVARAAGMRVLGPNCQGFFNVHGSVAATFSPAADPRRGAERPTPGNVAVVSQSGALGFALFHAGVALGLGFSHVVSCGNSADVDVLDVIELLVDDEHTDVVLVVLEGLHDGPRFRELAARAARRGTRLVVSKLGRSAAGSRAAASHTAHLAGSSAAYDAVFQRHGVLSATDLEELVDVGMALARCAAAAGPRVGIVSTSGGAGVWLADSCDDLGLEVPALAGTANPLDLTGRVISNANVAATVRGFVEDPALDAVVLSTSLSDPLVLAREAGEFTALVSSTAKPILVLTYTRPSPASVSLLAELGLPWATSPARVARMIHHLVAAGRVMPEVRERSLIAGPPALSFAGGGEKVLDEPTTKRLLRAWGVAVPEGGYATSAGGAARLAASLGGRVVVKVVAADVVHKSEIGGVALDVESSGVERVFGDLARRAEAAAGIAMDGVLVERMANAGHEIIVGGLYDETFGPLVMVGSGGIYAEVLRDTCFLPLPLDHAEATRAVERLRCAPVLAGARGRPAADVPALADLLVRVGAIVERGDVSELDLNPVVVHDAGKGITVLDAWLALRGPRVG
ncbi:hypothetical protein BCD48_27835 [Pseudofrankia sp. BMG5.36]|nr:hypothetical protein BCD48_27835 [Pseudofrankia sp. BMG5.36]